MCERRESEREGEESKTFGKILRDTLEDTVKSSRLLGNIDVLLVGASILMHNIFLLTMLLYNVNYF